MDKLKYCMDSVRAYGARFKPYGRVLTLAGATAAITNFPALIKFTNDSALQAHAASDGSDVYFTAGGVEVAKELDWYDGTTGSGAWWVQVPLITTSGAVLVMHYGTGTAHADNKAALWSDYRGVFHFSTASTYLQDSSPNGNHLTDGTKSRHVEISTAPTGRGIKTGFAANDSSSAGSWYNSAIFDSLGIPCNLSTYGNYPTDLSGFLLNTEYGRVVSSSSSIMNLHYNNYPAGFNANVRSDRNFGWVRSVRSNSSNTSPGVYDGTVNYYDNYGDISDKPIVELSYWNQATGTVILDEIRVGTTDHSDAWIAYEWGNLMTNSSFVTYGAEVRI